MDSECVSCGACVQACPTATLMENSIIEQGQPEHSVITTCAYCGVGCAFEAEMKGDQVVRMMPNKDGGANEGTRCVKGRFAFGYATHQDRITTPMIRDNIDEPWRRSCPGTRPSPMPPGDLRDIQQKHGRNSIGAITSSRCTNEETYLVQKLVRAAFGNNNVDTCARVCHSPTGYGLKSHAGRIGRHAGLRLGGASRRGLVIGANPTDAHPVFASRLKRRLREGARLIVVDPRRIDLVESPHVHADYHLPLRPGTNVAVHQRDGARDRQRGPGGRGVHRRALRPGVLRTSGASSSAIRATLPETGGGSDRHRAGANCARPRGSMPPAATARSTTAWA